MTYYSAAELWATRALREDLVGTWVLADIPALGVHGLKSTRRGASIRLLVAGSSVTLHLLRHPWSGRAEVSFGGNTTSVDLHDDSTGTTCLTLTAPEGLQPFRAVTVKVLPDRTPGAPSPGEVWILAVETGAPAPGTARTVPLSKAVDFVRGDFADLLVLRNDDSIGEVLRQDGAWARRHVRIWQRLLPKGATVVDAGAHIGHHSVTLSRIVGPRGRVLALEPQRRLHALLCANLLLNDCDNASAVRVAVSDHDRGAVMAEVDYRSPGNFGGLGLAGPPQPTLPAGAGEAVPTDTLDALVATHLDGRRLDFLKIDVQGYEPWALAGASGLLRDHRPVVQLEIGPRMLAELGVDYSEVMSHLDSAGYDLTEVDQDGIRRPRAWSGDPDEEWDLLATPRGR